jgi:hypothetical protein
LLASKRCLHLGETTWPIQIKEQDDGYMWAASNADTVYFYFEPTRSGSNIQTFFGATFSK